VLMVVPVKYRFRRPQFYVCSEDSPASVLIRKQLGWKKAQRTEQKAGWDYTSATARDCPNKAADLNATTLRQQ